MLGALGGHVSEAAKGDMEAAKRRLPKEAAQRRLPKREAPKFHKEAARGDMEATVIGCKCGAPKSRREAPCGT